MSQAQPQESKPVVLHQATAPIGLPPAATWPLADVITLFDLRFNELMFQVQQSHRIHFPDSDVLTGPTLAGLAGAVSFGSYSPRYSLLSE